MSDSKIITINVGGGIHQISLKLINKYPTSILARTISTTVGTIKDKDVYFFDRSKDLFMYIIELIRTGILFIPKHIPNDMMKKEVDYWGFEWDEEQIRYENCAEKFQEQVEEKVQERINWFIKRCLEHSLLKNAKEEGFYQQTFIMGDIKNFDSHINIREYISPDLTKFIETAIEQKIPDIKKEIEYLKELEKDVDNLRTKFTTVFPHHKREFLKDFLNGFNTFNNDSDEKVQFFRNNCNDLYLKWEKENFKISKNLKNLENIISHITGSSVEYFLTYNLRDLSRDIANDDLKSNFNIIFFRNEKIREIIVEKFNNLGFTFKWEKENFDKITKQDMYFSFPYPTYYANRSFIKKWIKFTISWSPPLKKKIYKRKKISKE